MSKSLVVGKNPEWFCVSSHADGANGNGEGAGMTQISPSFGGL